MTYGPPLTVLLLLVSFLALNVNSIDNSNLTETTKSPSIYQQILPSDGLFLEKIFDKYGDRETIDYEGFEHLLDNLGLGGNVFQTPHELELHRINGSFKQFHDNTHRHKRHTKLKIDSSKIGECLSPKDILEMNGLETSPGDTKIDYKSFLKLCPALVYQLDQKSCYKIENMTSDINDMYLAWIYTGLSVLLISATGLLGVAIMPIIHSRIFNKLLHFMVALAIGTLCGDALLHLLPHALNSHEHTTQMDDHNIPIFKCCITFLTIFLFYIVESFIRVITGRNGHGHSHSHSLTNENRERRQDVELDVMIEGNFKKPRKSPTPTALMVMMGDALHNITDGLAIGAAFSSDPVTGFATSLAVFFHELPHELGDFAVLLRSGMSIKKAMWCNVLSSILSFAGAAVGLLLAEDHASTSQWIYAATAGTFLYIALADLIPELNENGNKNLIEIFLALLGILSGGAIMLSIALHEDSLKTLLDV